MIKYINYHLISKAKERRKEETREEKSQAPWLVSYYLTRSMCPHNTYLSTYTPENPYEPPTYCR